MLALVALAIWAVFSFFAAMGQRRLENDAVRLAAAHRACVPVALPIFVLTMFWFATRQSAEDEQFPEDD